MSLLMDALRRAEASTAEAPANDEAVTAAPAQSEPPESLASLELEPINAPLPGTPIEASNSGAVNQAAPTVAEHAPAETQASQQQAQAAFTASRTRRSSARRRVIFVVTGLATVAIVLAVYYLWESSKHVAPYVPPAATLIDTAPAATETDDTGILTEAVTVTTDKLTEAVAKVNPVVAEKPDRAAPVATTQRIQSIPDESPPAPAAEPYRIEIHKSRQSGKMPSALKQAYQDYQRQAYSQAEQGYRQVLRRYPDNRDAMLGLAAIALHQGSRQVARYYYERLLQVDPADKTARLALQALSAGRYSLENGSQIKHWLQTDQNNAQLHFALGNQYAASGQWKEAQQAYFEAYRIEPANADYAFNLAVSLDQLRLPNQALDYYIQARDLADKGGALFGPQQLERRITQLQALTELNR